MSELEIWLIGTPDQVTAALAALADAGRVVAASKPEPLYGNDAGRTRRYARVSITAARPAPVTAGRAGRRGKDDQGVIDLADRRTA